MDMEKPPIRIMVVRDTMSLPQIRMREASALFEGIKTSPRRRLVKGMRLLIAPLSHNHRTLCIYIHRRILLSNIYYG